MAIDLNSAMQKYSEATPASANRWAAGAINNADKFIRNATSTEAENNYKLGVERSVQNQSRLKGLQNVTASDYANGVQNSVQIYQAKTAGSANKWANKFSPYAQVIDQTVNTLPPKISGDIAGNILRRVTPIAIALNNRKMQGVSTRALGVPSPVGRTYSPIGQYGR